MNLLYEKMSEYLEAREKNDLTLSLYIDYPFCISNCTYCIYNSLSFDIEMAREYEKALLKRLSHFESLFNNYQVDTLYFGGGTPSLLSFDSLIKIKKLIPNYDKIKAIKTEVHPKDMDVERIEFYSKEMNFDIISLGVQSFDKNSCINQKRIFIDADNIARIVYELKKRNIWVNIDLVALFGGDAEDYWKVFEDDLSIACEFVLPDVITTVINYRTKLNYIDQLIRFRNILKTECDKTQYIPPKDVLLNIDYDSRKKYGKNDHWLGTSDYWQYFRTHCRYSCSGPKGGINKKQITIAIGGAGKHKVYSYNPDGTVIYSYYSFERKKFVDEVVKI